MNIKLSEVATASAITITLSAILWPALANTKRGSAAASIVNVKKIATAAITYATDYDGMIVISIDGDMTHMTNSRQKGDSGLQPSKARTDSWVLNLMPYHNDLSVYVDPGRVDVQGIFSGPPLGDYPTPDPGFDPLKNTFKGQNRFPMYGLNYLFLSPIRMHPQSLETIAEAKNVSQALDPAKTVYFTSSRRWTDNERGWYSVNAPGLWNALAADHVQYIPYWYGSECSGDWCGAHADANSRTANFYGYPDGGAVAFLDGHAEHMLPGEVAVGTDWQTVAGGGLLNGGNTKITDKSKYLWNLDNNYYGAG